MGAVDESDTAAASDGALVLGAVGTVVGAACLVASAALGVIPTVWGESMARGETIMAGIVFVLSGVVSAAALRARKRLGVTDRRGKILARVVPVLLVGGGVLGVVVAQGLVSTRFEGAASTDAGACDRFAEVGAIDQAACLPVARACRYDPRNGPGLPMPPRRGVNAPPSRL